MLSLQCDFPMEEMSCHKISIHMRNFLDKGIKLDLFLIVSDTFSDTKMHLKETVSKMY